MAAKKTAAKNKQPAETKEPVKKGAGALFAAVLAALLIALSVRTFGFSLVYVRSAAMNDTLFAGDIVLISRAAQPETGNIVLAGALNGSVFLRVAGEPGDTVAMKNGQTMRNSMPLHEPYAKGAGQGEMPETRLDAGVYLLLPDDRSYEGALVEQGGIAGVARAIIWPISRAGFL